MAALAMADSNGISENRMAAYLFVDTFEFEELASQSECRVGQRDALMTGYESYIIEQWACERRVNTVVASYTGNSQHVVEVQVLLVPTNLDEWSPATFSHFEELVRMHILPKETNLGNMLVTSLSSLPSNLSLVSMSGNFRESFSYFVVNENLRRLNVVGRIAVTAEPPSDSMIATFRRVFMIPAVVNARFAVQEVATLIQISLFYFGLLDPRMIDGLLCDHTLKAIETWWSVFGRQRFQVALPRPQDKLYMRVSCAALVGTITGARKRLSALGLKPPKDPFDAEEFVECIRRFQKLMKIPRTSKLDDQTYFKLIHETANISSSGNLGMLTVMKSTVKEGLSGKASEAVDDWETLNLEQLVQTVRGNRAKYLWQGKGEERVPHLHSSLPIRQVGPKTGIPLLSLATDDMDRHHHMHRHHHSHVSEAHPKPHEVPLPPHPKALHNQLHTASNVVAEGPNHLPASTEHEADGHPLNQHDYMQQESQTSLVNRFRKKKPGLGDAFDEKIQQPTTSTTTPSAYAHLRSQSTSSDNWFARSSPQLNMPYNTQNGTSPASFMSSEALNSQTEALSSDQLLREPEAEATVPNFEMDVPVTSLLTKDDQNVGVTPGYAKDLEVSKLRRTASMGEIDQNIFPWEPLASAPQVLNMYDAVQRLQSIVAQRMESDEVVNLDSQAQIKSSEAAIADAQRENVLIQYHANASLRKEDAVRRRVKELEAFMARLDYEIATLSVKLKDVDQSVLAFAAKVDSANIRWHTMNTVVTKPWWTRWFAWNAR